MPRQPFGTRQLVLVDHHDSYVHNLAHLIASVTGALPLLVQHDEVDASWVLDRASQVVLSPGPGHPGDVEDFAVGRQLLRQDRIPVLGVCLGMQGLVQAYGGRIERIEPAHGRVSRVEHTGRGLFEGLPQGLAVVRYHSLGATSVPERDLEVTARSEDGVVMAVRHRTRPLAGVQFHPESVLSEHGRVLVINWLSGAP